MDEYKKAMKGINITSVNEVTLGEASIAYKSLNDIIDVISEGKDKHIPGSKKIVARNTGRHENILRMDIETTFHFRGLMSDIIHAQKKPAGRNAEENIFLLFRNYFSQ